MLNSKGKKKVDHPILWMILGSLITVLVNDLNSIFSNPNAIYMLANIFVAIQLCIMLCMFLAYISLVVKAFSGIVLLFRNRGKA